MLLKFKMSSDGFLYQIIEGVESPLPPPKQILAFTGFLICGGCGGSNYVRQEIVDRENVTVRWTIRCNNCRHRAHLKRSAMEAEYVFQK